MKKIFISLLIIQAFSAFVMAQEWIVPADKQGRLSPFVFTDSIRKVGSQLYNLNCLSCHGTPGKGNYQRFVPPSGDPASEKIQHNRDGEIFYKVSEGKSPMPTFKNTLTSIDIWNIIAFIRSFNSAYVQSVMPEITSSAYPGALIRISLLLTPGNDSVCMQVSAIKGMAVIPVSSAGVKLFVKRTFGLLPLDEEKITNEKGIASFSIPLGLPGDTAGIIHVSARFTDEDKYGSVSKDTLLQAGVKVIPVSLVKERAMWNVVRKAPLWILLTFSLGVLVVWGFIIMVLFKLRDIYMIGDYTEHKKNNEA
jgi:mono/diheme cytochrome c family protein